MSHEPTQTSVFERTCCPICGGKSGFTYKLTIRGIQFYPWQESGESPYFENDTTGRHGAYRCEDCGKIIRSDSESAKKP